MTEFSQEAPRPAPWGYLATAAWLVLAVAVTAVAVSLVVLLMRPDVLGDDIDIMKDGRLIAITGIASAVVQIAVLALAAKLARWPVAEYLGLIVPSRHDAIRAFAILIVFLLAYDAMTWTLGRDIVTRFQVDAYTSAKAAGTLTLLWIAIVVTAPLSEEIVFRGFMFRGWVRTARSAWPAILVITALFAIIHVQYNWYELTQVFFIGLLLAWVRWWSGSSLLTIALHATVNFYAMLQTVAKLEWFA